MKNFLSLVFFCLAPFFFNYCLAKEPVNLACFKKELIRYHDSGEYNKDIDEIITSAIHYLKTSLKNIPRHHKPAIGMDVDETAISSYQLMHSLDFGMLKNKFEEFENQKNATLIAPVLKLYCFAKKNHVAVFFITGRPIRQREYTADNLRDVGYRNWDGLIFKSDAYKGKPDWDFKIATRKKITEQGYHIILNIGDQEGDLKGGYADKTFKLPNPFYLIPKAYQ